MNVYVTHGRKYHTDPECPRMLGGEWLHDWDGDEYHGFYGGFTAGSYRHEVSSPNVAAARGKLPCLACVPAEQRAFPPLYGQTFGHEPVDEYDRPDVTHIVCARCTRWTSWRDVGVSVGQRVPWPCTSAIILGLAPRTEVTA